MIDENEIKSIYDELNKQLTSELSQFKIYQDEHNGNFNFLIVASIVRLEAKIDLLKVILQIK